MTPVLHAAGVVTSSWPLTSMGRVMATVLVSCALCVHREGGPFYALFVRCQVYRLGVVHGLFGRGSSWLVCW